MAGLRTINQSITTLVAGTNWLIIQLPAGSILKVANAINSTKPGQHINLHLVDSYVAYLPGNAPVLPPSNVLKDGTQIGRQDLVTWNGTIEISQSQGTLAAVIWNCDVGDQLVLAAGVEW